MLKANFRHRGIEPGPPEVETRYLTTRHCGLLVSYSIKLSALTIQAVGLLETWFAYFGERRAWQRSFLERVTNDTYDHITCFIEEIASAGRQLAESGMMWQDLGSPAQPIDRACRHITKADHCFSFRINAVHGLSMLQNCTRITLSE
ncbi:hypothetical protein CEXT_313671 [Caerostris extrusa]|uniref:Uncharacterized protein n=1 Tax=Caerostris extrusa TaxID=172846 RepID=A0AAV4MZS2_CAEEX|nr:hypothetical protein CEXT_313671 [Caerostris extrusa]